MQNHITLSATSRYALASGAAFVVTMGLGLWMAQMIAVNFVAEDRHAAQTYEINPEIIDIEPVKDRAALKPYKTVKVPPPPARLPHQSTALPGEGDITLDINTPTFDKPVIKPTDMIITVSDTDAQPLFRPVPIMPPRAEKSGHCKVAFDVSPEGSPFNIRTPYCTDKMFARASIKAVQKWTFRPKSVSGRAVAMTGVQNQITFRLTDERGHLIAE